MTAAQAIAAALTEAGVTRYGAQAALLRNRNGEPLDQGTWSTYRHEGQSPGEDMIRRWLQALDAAGYPLRLEWAPDGSVVARPVESASAEVAEVTADVIRIMWRLLYFEAGEDVRTAIGGMTPVGMEALADRIHAIMDDSASERAFWASLGKTS